MTVPIEIVIRQTSEGNAIEQTSKSILLLANSSGAVVGSLEKVGQVTGESLAMSRKEWMRTGSEVAFYAKAVTSAMGSSNNEIAKTIGVVTQLGESFMFGGGVGIAVAAISSLVGIIASELPKAADAAKKAADEIRKPFEETKKQIEDLAKLKGLDATAKQIGVTKDALAQYIQATETSATKVDRLNTAQMNIAEVTARLKQMDEAEALMLMGKSTPATQLYNDSLGNLRAARQNDIDYLKRQTLEEARLNTTVVDEIKGTQDLATQIAKLPPTMDEYIAAGAKIMSDDTFLQKYNDAKKLADAIRDVKQATNSAAASLAAAAFDKFKGAVSKSITTQTTITQEDIDATKAGKYQDKADEYRRRLEAIAAGTANVDQYGAKFASFFNSINMGAQEAADAMKDFSFFSNPKNLEAFTANGGLDAIEADIQRQVDGIIGQSELMGAAMKAVWDKLPEEKKKALAKTGITTWEDLQKNDLKLKILKDPAFDETLAAARDAVLSNFPPEMQTTISVNYTMDQAGPTLGEKAKDNGGRPIDSNDSGQGKHGATFANGGIGVFNRDQSINVHAGESYWISGTQNQVAPPGVTINFNGATVSTDRDMIRLAREVARQIARHQ
jgi:hypothetical protein